MNPHSIIRIQEILVFRIIRIQEILIFLSVSWQGVRDSARLCRVSQAHSREPRIEQKLDFFKAVNPVSFLGQIITHYWY